MRRKRPARRTSYIVSFKVSLEFEGWNEWLDIGLTFAANSASKVLGSHISVLVVIAITASQAIVDKLKSLGAAIFQLGSTLTECALAAEKIHRETGATVVPTPFNSLGQGTAGLEFLEQVTKTGRNKLDVVMVPSGRASLVQPSHVRCIRVFGNINEPEDGAAKLGKA
ncbi:hypothetical protein B9Z65_4947 [Elsinoe australis]|uniref:Tryptophan synthase beta chain-like PALP domain-containing protein n=1 Tax=Elsinoe australis TaxID=40998 RepID=A0A2P7ZCQ8_9PEZI|nr:hypothetical protein B9Z65_4947 [Elsinoe australis]